MTNNRENQTKELDPRRLTLMERAGNLATQIRIGLKGLIEPTSIPGMPHVSAGDLKRQDGGTVLLDAYGLEMNLTSFLTGQYHLDETGALGKELVDKYIKGKRVLVVPAYSINPFIFKLVGAKEVLGVDADLVSVEWHQAMRQYFYANRLGEALMASALYPNTKEAIRTMRSVLKKGQIVETLPEHVADTVKCTSGPNPLGGVQIRQGVLGEKIGMSDAVPNITELCAGSPERFDFIYIPYLLGIKKGIESEEGVIKAFNELWELGHENSVVMIGPFSGSEPDIATNFGASSGVLQKIEDLMPKDKLEVQKRFYLNGVEMALLKVKKTAA